MDDILIQLLTAIREGFLTEGAFRNVYAVGRAEFLDLLTQLQNARYPFTLEEFSSPGVPDTTDGVAIKFAPLGSSVYVFSTTKEGLRQF